MASSGSNTIGSQFFITYARHNHLNSVSTIVGRYRADAAITVSLLQMHSGELFWMGLCTWCVLTLNTYTEAKEAAPH